MNQTEPNNDVSQEDLAGFQTVLTQAYGVQGVLMALPGEYDLNYYVQNNGQATHVLKVMRPECEETLVDMQCRVLAHIQAQNTGLPTPRVCPTRDSRLFLHSKDNLGCSRIIWCTSVLPGQNYGDVRPHTLPLIRQLGDITGRLDQALSTFTHQALDRSFKWNLLEALWIRDALDLISNSKHRAMLQGICDRFENHCLPRLKTLEHQALHNDLNDYNVLVDFDQKFESSISGVVDFGDMVLGPKVCELAIAGAYIVLDQSKPLRALAQLVAGYDQSNTLSDDELELIFPLVLMRLAVSVVNSALMKQTNPDDPYVVVSEKPAWEFLHYAESLAPGLPVSQIRVACKRPVTPSAGQVMTSIEEDRGSYASVLGLDLSVVPKVDLSVAAGGIPQNPMHMTDAEALSMGAVDGHSVSVSYYGEPRLLYTTEAFRDGSFGNSDRRTVHTGIDIFAPAGHDVFAPVDGMVRLAENRAERLDYGGLVILEHTTKGGDLFWTLYGHLAPRSIQQVKIGDTIRAGQHFADFGSPAENGGWAPHLHFQMAVATKGIREDWLGVADPDDADLWTQIYPNPAALLNLDPAGFQYHVPDARKLTQSRNTYFAGNLKFSYDDPCVIFRGWRQYLFDEYGRPYLDAYNNVPHVGHAHPRMEQVASRQLRNLNTNTRYLHPVQAEFAQALTEKLPDSLSVCFFLNSASEANEVALRLARAHTGGYHMIVPDHGYHGITTGAMDISAYKFNGPGGRGAPDWVQVVAVPDIYRGAFKASDPDPGEHYAQDIDRAVDNIKECGGRLAGFIAESFPSVAGQLVPPPGYLQHVYAKIRVAGGVCIADEVQTGLGRLGTYYWGFEQQEVVPDMVVLGKPLGNGYPVAALVTTPAIAESFVTGMEFFSTFGGSTLSCVMGREVLRIVDEEGLQENARITGDYLLKGLTKTATKHAVVGDVRGMGFFIGVELILDKKLTPATKIARYVINRLREKRILIGTDGPYDNVLKVRPPLTFSKDDADRLITTLDSILAETPCRINS